MIFLLVLFFHIGSRLRRGVKVQGGLFAVPHYQVSRIQQVFHGAAIAAVRDAEGVLEINRAEGKVEVIHVAAQIKIQTERNAGQGCEGFLPFADIDLKEIFLHRVFVDGDVFLVGISFLFFVIVHMLGYSLFYINSDRKNAAVHDSGSKVLGMLFILSFTVLIL